MGAIKRFFCRHADDVLMFSCIFGLVITVALVVIWGTYSDRDNRAELIRSGAQEYIYISASHSGEKWLNLAIKSGYVIVKTTPGTDGLLGGITPKLIMRYAPENQRRDRD